MKYNINSYSDTEVLTTTVEKEITLSKDSQSLIFQMFSKNIYSNPIGSLVREIASNCFDSHIEASVNLPVLIKKSKDNQTGTNYISFIDYGVGMSPERINDVFSVMFSSTKRSDGEQLGCFGLGSRAPLAYKRSVGFGEGEYDNSYFIITNYNGVKYVYQIYDSKNSPKITLLHSEPTTERNGTEIRVPVLEKDLFTFEKEMVRQLYYFENIIYEGFGKDEDENNSKYVDILNADYQIIRGKTFLFRGGEYSEYVHICLGKVAYPIDYNVLGLNGSDYRIPVAIKLNIGEIGVTVSRESLDYSENTIKVLKKKLEAVKKEAIELITKQYTNVVTLEDYFKLKTNFGQLYFKNGSSFNVGSLIKKSDIDLTNFKYNFMKMPNDKELFRFFFEAKFFGKKNYRRRRYSSYDNTFEGGYEEILNHKNLLYVENEFNRKTVKQSYLKSIHEKYYIIVKRNLAKDSMRVEISDSFNVAVDKTCDINGKPIPYVASLIEMQEEYFNIVRNHTVNYDTLEIPEDFVARKKRTSGLTKEILESTIPVNFCGRSGKYRVNVNDLINFTGKIFYCTQEDEHVMYNAFHLYNNLWGSDNVVNYYSDYNHRFEKRDGNEKKGGVMFATFSVTNIKYVKYNKKAVHVSEFFTKMLLRKENAVMEYFQTSEIVEKYKGLDNLYKNENFVKIDTVWGNRIIVLAKYFSNLKNDKLGNLSNHKDLLSKYFDLTVIKQTAEQKKIIKAIDDLLFLQKANEEILKYIDIPWNGLESDNKMLFDILKKVMVL